MDPIMAIDPGPTESAYVCWNGDILSAFGKCANGELVKDLTALRCDDILVIEQVKCYGMTVADSVFDTVFWSGRFAEAFPGEHYRMPRMEVKMHLCHNSRAKDGNITMALIDRFAPGVPNRGKGTKKQPGFFYGFKSDIWQAFALAVTFWDKHCMSASMMGLTRDFKRAQEG